MRDTTRHKIINVAQSLFALKGAGNTTMHDVAMASGLGRRTLYTYFKTREELYNEVIDREITSILKQLNRVAEMALSPEKKIARFMVNHMKTVENLIRKDHLLKIEFLKRSERIENFRQEIDKHERECFATAFREGIQTGIFQNIDYESSALLTVTMLKGLEYQFIIDNFGIASGQMLELYEKILFRGIKSLV